MFDAMASGGALGRAGCTGVVVVFLQDPLRGVDEFDDPRLLLDEIGQLAGAHVAVGGRDRPARVDDRGGCPQRSG
ncbi:MAG: hypothetical protein U5K73_09740 [Halofilum sp. (in: g-proteobacteria)]|nr:hypothetical protein [Halofilum sp. (in: g-proteobacteria)]